MNFPKHVLILCSRLDMPAGIERAIVNAANLFTSKGHQVSILILDGTPDIFFRLDTGIKVYAANLHFGITDRGNQLSRKLSFLRHLRVLRKLVNDISPDIVIATEYQFAIAARMALKREDIRLFSWEHHHFHHLKRNNFWKLLFKKYYPGLDMVICLNHEEAELFNQTGCKTTVIPNHLSFLPERKASLEHKQILTVGHLSKTKGTDLLPSIAAKVFEKYPKWKWKIIGDGRERKHLVNATDVFEIQKPKTQDIQDEYLHSAMYVLSSRFECFPLVLLEAMSLGVPPIAFDCPTGPKHIISHLRDGVLVEKENVEAMADAIIELIENEEKRKQLGSKAFENSKRFMPHHVYQQWEDLFNKM